MSGLSPVSSSSRSCSPSTAPTSCQTSPLSKITALDGMSTPQDDCESVSSRGTPYRTCVDLPRTQMTSKGGCWTCRLRRKKCDEQRDGDSCKTCKRLTIKCLGWGSKRPDWMRVSKLSAGVEITYSFAIQDKQKVEAYKADIKAQLIRAGLVRGQPRSVLLQQGAPLPSRQSSKRPSSQHRKSLPDTLSNVSALGLDTGATYQLADPFNMNHPGSSQSLSTANGGASQSLYQNLPGASFSDPTLSTYELNPNFSFDTYSPHSDPSPGVAPDQAFEYGIPVVADSPFVFEVQPASPAPDALSGTTSLQEACVMYYFEHVRSAQFVFAGNAVTNVTYSLILQDLRGPVTNAVCALASLHYHRMQVSRGLEEPSANPQTTNAHVFYNEAWCQLCSRKTTTGYNEADAIAALYLVCYSQMTGGLMDWVQMFQAACEWLVATGLPNDENAMSAYQRMTEVSQLAVKMILWIDIFSSPAVMRTPRFQGLYQRLFDARNNPWNGYPNTCEGSSFGVIGMEALSGCPEDALLGISDVSTLAFWKATQKRKGILSLRELIRRGDAIEQKLHQHRMEYAVHKDAVPLHPNLVTSMNLQDATPTEDMRQTIRQIFRETVSLYLQVVVNDANPGVPEIRGCVNNIVQLFEQLPSSVADRALVLPICLAGCMAEDSRQRDAFKGRLENQDECIGNVMKCRLVMEAVWQKRDISGGTVDWRDILQEREYNLLLI